MEDITEPIETMENTVKTITEEERIKKWEEENPLECNVKGCNYGLGGRPHRCRILGALNIHKLNKHGFGGKHKPMLTKEIIFQILVQCKEDCKLRAVINKAIEPFIIINPECKADELYEALKEVAKISSKRHMETIYVRVSLKDKKYITGKYDNVSEWFRGKIHERWEKENPYECDVEGCDYGLDEGPYRTNSGRTLNSHKYGDHNVTPKDGYDAKRHLLTFTIPEKYRYIQDMLEGMEEEKASILIQECLLMAADKEKDKGSG